MSTPAQAAHRGLMALLVGVSLALAWILQPFYGAILWGTVIALLFTPLYRLVLAWLGGRRTLAAVLTLTSVVLMVVLPVILVSVAMVREANAVVEQLQSGQLDPLRYFRGLFDALPDWATQWLDRFGLIDFDTLQRRVTDALTRASQVIATQALGIGQNTFEFLVHLLLTLYLAFYLIRDGEALALLLRLATPLAPSHRRELAAKFAVVIRATVKGNLLVAALQGTLGGLAFWCLGIQGAMLWAVLMALLSLVPAVGAALVWGPAALYLLVAGEHWQALALMAWGVLVIGLVDNVLRPLLVGKDTGLPDYLVLFATLGGIATFGIHGFVLGPAIAAMFVAVWHMHGSTDPG